MANNVCIFFWWGGADTGDNVKCEVGEKETILRLLQDIQLVTLPEPSSSSLWSDHSQSQSPMPVISDVTTMSNLDTASDSGMIPGSAFPSSSLISFPSPSSFPCEKYDFMPGTEKLLSNPNAPSHSPWYFFGFEPDPTGRPLDRSTAVCKLCGEHVGCGGGTTDLQNHLTNKHHIRPRDSNRDRTIGNYYLFFTIISISFDNILLTRVCATISMTKSNHCVIDQRC